MRFYVEKTSPLSPIQLVRTPGFGGSFLRRRPDGARRRPARLARRHRRAARGRRRAGRRRCGGRAPRSSRRRGARRASGARYALIELAWARAARARGARRRSPSTARARSSTPRPPPRCSRPRPGAIRFDAPAAGNRPGRHGIWQRPVERRRLRDAPLLVPWSEGGLAEAPRPHADAVVVPVPVAPSGPPAERDIAAITYGANPEKKGLDRVLAAWARGAAARARSCVVAGPATGRGPTRRACASRACCRAPSTARCCAARACSSARRGARTTGSRSSRRSPTAACSSRRPRPARTRRCRSRAQLDPRLVGGIAEGDPHRARRPRAGLRRARAARARAVAARGRRPRGAPSSCCRG